ncbi:hypothetical protein [Leptospira noguchii]|nr:hypothetical protein [Leptospira noguchii]
MNFPFVSILWKRSIEAILLINTMEFSTTLILSLIIDFSSLIGL